MYEQLYGSHGETILFQPEWGVYDMAVGKN
jgi:hypothetical protein